MGSWLDLEPTVAPAAAQAPAVAVDDSWLDIGDIAATRTAMPYDSLRFGCMRGTGRIWACDGRYVAYRPFNHVLDKKPNPEFQDRIEKFNRAGHFTHVGTFDEVMVFKLSPESPWYAKTEESYTAGQSIWKDIQHAAKLACARDWSDYHDLLQAMATGMMAGRDPQFARQQWEEAVNQIMIGVYQRSGPMPAEIRAGVQNIQKGRGYGGIKLLIATDVTQTGAKQYEGRGV